MINFHDQLRQIPSERKSLIIFVFISSSSSSLLSTTLVHFVVLSAGPRQTSFIFFSSYSLFDWWWSLPFTLKKMSVLMLMVYCYDVESNRSHSAIVVAFSLYRRHIGAIAPSFPDVSLVLMNSIVLDSWIERRRPSSDGVQDCIWPQLYLISSVHCSRSRGNEEEKNTEERENLTYVYTLCGLCAGGIHRSLGRKSLPPSHIIQVDRATLN